MRNVIVVLGAALLLFAVMSGSDASDPEPALAHTSAVTVQVGAGPAGSTARNRQMRAAVGE